MREGAPVMWVSPYRSQPEDDGFVVLVHAADEVTEEVVAAVGALLPQLARDAAPHAENLARIVAADSATLLVARDDGGPILGILTMLVYPTATGIQARIEDVVVDTAARGRGIGEALTRAALDRAAPAGARHVDLTSSPLREAANRLYRRVGFVRRETNLYRYELLARDGSSSGA